MIDRIDRIKQSFATPKLDESDTHDYINRHDPDFKRRKRKSQDHWDDHDNDMTDISVESLITYLQSLTDTTPTEEAINTQTVNPDMKKAITAYTHKTSQPHHQDTFHKTNTVPDSERQRIETIIASLEILLDKKTDHINLFAGSSFLDSIEKTVEKYNRL